MRSLRRVFGALVWSACAAAGCSAFGAAAPAQRAGGSPSSAHAHAHANSVAEEAARDVEIAATEPPVGVREDVEPFFPFLSDDDPSKSFSVGDTSHGYVARAKPVRESESLGILPRQRERNLKYGTDELVGILEHAGRELYTKTKTRLWIGNVGRRGGGDIPWSVSHNAGRDADVAFCYRRGKLPADPPDLVPLDAAGRAPSLGLELDVPRTWQVVKSLLTYPGAQVQFLFVSVPIKRALLAWARANKEPAGVIAHAEDVMHQPGNTNPHNDHLHLRLFCGKRDVEGGCVDTGIVHPWARLETPARELRARSIAARLDRGTDEERRRALLRLVLLDARAETRSIAGRLTDDAPSVRMAAASALADLGAEADAAYLTERFDHEDDAGVKIALARALPTLGGRATGQFLERAIDRTLAAPLATPANAAPKPAPEPIAAVHAPRSFMTVASTRASEALALTDALHAIEPWSQVSPLFPGAPVAADVPVSAGDFDDDVEPDHTAPALGPRDVAIALLDAAGQGNRLEPMPALLRALTHVDPELRTAAATALTYLTLRPLPTRFYEPGVPQKESDAIAASYEKRNGALAKLQYPTVVVTGLASMGYAIPRADARFGYEMVRAVAGPSQASLAAQRLLSGLLAHRMPARVWTPSQACHYWYKQVVARRTQLALPAPPKTLPASCG